MNKTPSSGGSSTIPVLVIGGPTASGKSGLALWFAQNYDGVIINADSVQLYKDLPTLTAQPDTNDLQICPHHLYGILDADQKTDAQHWREDAIEMCRDAHQNQKLPIIVGGSGFYIKALLEGLSPIPNIPNDIRTAGQALLEDIGVEEFRETLLKRDPDLARHLDIQNWVRLLRAWEVLEHTGRSIIHWQSLPKSGPPKGFAFFMISLIPDRDLLYQRCNDRFHLMVEGGALDQVQDLKSRIDQNHIPPDAPITRAIGYHPLARYLEQDISLNDAITQAQQDTRNYAKRQVTWFKNQITPDLILRHTDMQRLKDAQLPDNLSHFLSEHLTQS